MTRYELKTVNELLTLFDDKRLKKASCSCLLGLKDILTTLLAKVNKELEKFSD